jgi:hypothetical protein
MERYRIKKPQLFTLLTITIVLLGASLAIIVLRALDM